MLALDSVVEEAKFGKAQLDCQKFTDTVLLPDLTSNDGWSIESHCNNYLADVQAWLST